LNPELGTEKDLAALITALQKNGMGLVLDIVPNHMGIASPENSWWWDVLKNGRASPFANHFDIDWQSSQKILIPILADDYERVLQRGELQIATRPQTGEFCLRYFENEFPLAPDSIPPKFPGEKTHSNPAVLAELVERQNYCLTFWRNGGSRLNYRRFFAVNTLAGVRVDDEKVFNDVHALVKKWLGKNWRRPDEGIWEVRGGPREFLHSRMMCWVAFDRALRLALKRSLSGPLDVWQHTRDEIRNDVFTNFWDNELQSFVQAKGTKELDASALLMPMMRFISPVDPMWLSTMRALESHLIEDTLVRRYEVERTHVDGLPGTEGSFTACSFWYVECLARAGELEKAQLLFEKLLGYANHLGLYSEELGANGRHLGNFPQAFTHLALISAATYLDRALSGTNRAVWR